MSLPRRHGIDDIIGWRSDVGVSSTNSWLLVRRSPSVVAGVADLDLLKARSTTHLFLPLHIPFWVGVAAQLVVCGLSWISMQGVRGSSTGPLTLYIADLGSALFSTRYHWEYTGSVSIHR